MNYETGFTDGEAQAWKDRHLTIRRVRQVPRNEYDRGYWDGYCPRDPAWWLLRRPPAQAWWQERESEDV